MKFGLNKTVADALLFMKENQMIKFVVKIGDEELPYEFQEFWQFAFLVRFLNWYLGLPEGGIAKRVVEGLLRLAQDVIPTKPSRQ